jgi:hypothetical protein
MIYSYQLDELAMKTHRIARGRPGLLIKLSKMHS